MPFKLKLKKTRQYKVVSKNLFVMSVELLDGVIVECTLGADSSGKDCLDNVCQRLAIERSELYGLRYVSRTQQPRWVQLERPLKRQLDKYAASPQLYLRVMYYVVSGTALISDEVTRYHYFLQLKHDLLEGRIACDLQQAVALAAYSRQAEYGNLDTERHTVDYLKNVLQFPKHMLDNGTPVDGAALAGSGQLEWLTAAVVRHHLALHNMSQAQAEEGYISACQLLSGYGQETFVARDQLRGRDVLLAVSLTGITVAGDNDPPKSYRWSDITNVINHKCLFSLECAAPGESASFVLATPDDGKYVWRLCVLQHTFYMKHQQAMPPPPRIHHHTEFHAPEGLSDSREELDGAGVLGGSALLSAGNTVLGAGGTVLGSSGHLGPPQRARSTSCLELASEQPARAGATTGPQHPRAPPPTYRAAPDYETAVQHKRRERCAQMASYTPAGALYGSHPDVTQHTQHLRHPPANYSPLRLVHLYKPPPPYPLGVASNSTPDLARPRLADPLVSGSSPDLVSRRQQHLAPRHRLHSHAACAPAVGAHNPHVVLDHAHCVAPPDHEPIYENVPAWWRHRAHSLTDDRRGSSRPTIPRHATNSATQLHNHYENLKGGQNGLGTSVPDVSTLAAATERLEVSGAGEEDETPYQSLSTHKTSEDASQRDEENVTSITIGGISNPAFGDSPPGGDGLHSTTLTSGFDSTTSTAHSDSASLGSKEKKRRRWGMLIGRRGEQKSATLGRPGRPPAPHKQRWSTGAPRPPPLSKETLCQALERDMADGRPALAFERVAKCRDGDHVRAALLPENSRYNGFSSEHLPYDDNRVRLNPTPTNRHGYINASHITMSVGSSQRFYVVARAPGTDPPRPHLTAETLSSNAECALWWECVWQVGARVTALVSGDVRPLYLPTSGVEHYGKFSVRTEWQQVSDWGRTTRARVQCADKPARTVWHVHYTQWPDALLAPRTPDTFLSFLTEVDGLRAASLAEPLPLHSGNAPVVIACAAGAGRSGVAVAADVLLHALDHNHHLDVARTVGLLHQQRASLVHNVHQYRFLHALLLHYLTRSRLI